uniref:Uncharacterized protein n=1 Tax=Arundo donax TaxID=35708 RepID=A0A0A9G1J0_ARUDO
MYLRNHSFDAKVLRRYLVTWNCGREQC